MNTYTATDIRRFWSFVQMTGTCWIWTGTSSDRYGRFNLGNAALSAHRFAYELFMGDIPEAMQIDHICERTKCVNPRHLEVVSPYENLIRANGMGARNARKTHCNKGHEFTAENTYLMPGGGRQCLTCKQEWTIANREKVRASARAATRRYRERKRQAKNSE